MEALLPIIVQIIAGVVGGEAVGASIKQAAMSHLPRIISGAIGGVAGGQILGALVGDPATAGAMGGILGDAIGGVGGGAILTAIVGMVMKSMGGRTA